MSIPSRKTILGRVIKAGNYLFEKCPYFPCHKELETCNLCYCIFYPCEDTGLGEYVTSKKGGQVWSCMHCSWAHKKETVDNLRQFLSLEKYRGLAPNEMYKAFTGRQKSGQRKA